MKYKWLTQFHYICTHIFQSGVDLFSHKFRGYNKDVLHT